MEKMGKKCLLKKSSLTPLYELLREKNLKVTPQRVAILENLRRDGHASIDDIYANVKRTVPSVSLATVYKNILALQESNIVRSIKAQNQKQKYEIIKPPHIHLVCEICGEIRDVDMNMEIFLEECKKVSGYQEINEVQILLTGVCDKCSNARQKNSGNKVG